jgi:hypothetical protein
MSEKRIERRRSFRRHFSKLRPSAVAHRAAVYYDQIATPRKMMQQKLLMRRANYARFGIPFAGIVDFQ